MDDEAAAEKELSNIIAQIEYDRAVFERDLAIAQAGIARDAAIADVPWYQKGPFGDTDQKVAGMYDTLIGKMASTPLPPKPSAQTGTPMGGFMVPETSGSTKADNVGLNVSPGEEVTVRPRGESGSGQNIIVQIDRDVIFDIVTDGLDSGDIVITADNIQTA